MDPEATVSASGKSMLTGVQRTLLFLLRIAIGWHFLYEGIVKLVNPNWTSAPFLLDSRWVFSDVFHWMASNPTVLQIVDFMNIWGLLLIGGALLLGVFPRFASLMGIFLLSLYYAANPPFVGITSRAASEGNYLVVDKNLVELVALCVLVAFPARSFLCLDRGLAALVARWRGSPKAQPAPVEGSPDADLDRIPQAAPASISRRELLGTLASIPFVGGFVYAFMRKKGWQSHEEARLLELTGGKVDAVTSATVKTFEYTTMKDLKGQVPRAKIGDLELSRLFLGGNLMGGWAHSRDLIYVSKLIKTYHSDQKVFDTFRVAEKCGINTILTNPQLARVINDYWIKEGGKIQFFSDCGIRGDAMEGVKMSLRGRAHSCYVQGEISDRLVREGKVEEIAKVLDFIRKQKIPDTSLPMPAGIGAHRLETVKACVEKGIKPDYWVKTLHHRNYWSAKPEEENDNIWCRDPEETIAFMSQLPEPWIAFKTLAAGAIHPNEAFKFALQGGADFLCVGMYDFQIVEDVNIALDVLAVPIERKRRWLPA